MHQRANFCRYPRMVFMSASLGTLTPRHPEALKLLMFVDMRAVTADHSAAE
jgi:hypothetical protein